MNRQLKRLGIALVVLYALLFAQLNWVQVFNAEAYKDNPNNRRDIVEAFSRDRGQILSADGTVLARSVPSDDRFELQREYPERDLFAHVTGYLSFNLGATGVEKEYNSYLSGDEFELEVQSIRDLFVDKSRTGDVTLTIRKDVQEVARQQLGNREGAVVAIDPRNGAVLALWSFPSFDPNLLASHNLEKVNEASALLQLAPGKPLVPAAYRERYFPGSTFKTVTATAGLESGKVTREQPVYPTESSYTPPLTTRPIRNFGGSTCGGALFEILRVSCNTAFARMGVDNGAETMAAAADSYGFDSRPPIDLNPGAVESEFPEASFFERNTPALAQSAIGQNSVQATPLQMALVAAAVANKGVIMRPHVMAEIRDSEGEVVERGDAKEWRTVASEKTISTLREGLIGVVQGGTASGLAIPGQEVGGKTGTAQIGGSAGAHAWIIGFAGPPGEARVAVAVIVEGGGSVSSEQTGGRVAAPIARAVMEKVLQTPDQPGG